MEFIKNIFKKIKEFFTIHKRVAMLEIQQKSLDTTITALRKRIEMLEFKAKGMNYYFYKLLNGPGRSHWVVEYARPTHVVRVHLYNETGIREPEINDDYLEFYENGKIARVYVALDNDDALVDVDLDLYKKAYPERFETQGAVYVNNTTGVDTVTTYASSATDDFVTTDNFKTTVEKIQKSGVKPKKTKKEKK